MDEAVLRIVVKDEGGSPAASPDGGPPESVQPSQQFQYPTQNYRSNASQSPAASPVPPPSNNQQSATPRQVFDDAHAAFIALGKGAKEADALIDTLKASGRAFSTVQDAITAAFQVPSSPNANANQSQANQPSQSYSRPSRQQAAQPFDPVEEAKKRLEQEQRRQQIDEEYQKLNPSTPTSFDPVAEAKKRLDADKQRAKIDEEYQKLLPPPASFDPVAEAQKRLDNDKRRQQIDEEYQRLNPTPVTVFDPAEEARKRADNEDRKKLIDTEYEKLRPTPQAAPFDPREAAKNQFESEVRKEQIKQAYEKIYGASKQAEGIFDVTLSVAQKMRGTLGGTFGTLVGLALDVYSAFQEMKPPPASAAQVEAERRNTEASRPPTPAPPEATPAPPEATPAPPEATPAPPEATPAPPEATPAPPEATPAPPEATPAPPEAKKYPGSLFGREKKAEASGQQTKPGSLFGREREPEPEWFPPENTPRQVNANPAASNQQNSAQEWFPPENTPRRVNQPATNPATTIAKTAMSEAAPAAKSAATAAAPTSTAATAAAPAAASAEGAGAAASAGGGAVAAAGPYVAIALAVVTAAKMLVDALNTAAERYAEYSPEIATAQANVEVKTMLSDIRRAQESGPELARYLEMQGDLQNKYEDIKIKLLTKLMPIATVIGTSMEAILDAIDNLSSLDKIASSIGQLVGVGSSIQNTMTDQNREQALDPTNVILGINNNGVQVPGWDDAQGGAD